MGLRTKFNFVLLLVFLVGIVVAGYISHTLVHQNARDEVEGNAGVMMAAALATRDYTVTHVKPTLEMQLLRQFLRESVPAFAASETFAKLRNDYVEYKEYTYKEATLNPTNPRDLPADWERDIIEYFRTNPEKKESTGVRESATGPALYLARPIQIKNADCLSCHSTAAAAPKTMLDLYGDKNGFGWKLNEIVGAQIVSVPMSLPIKKAEKAFNTFMLSLGGVFLMVFIGLNVMLRRIVIAPLTRMSEIADGVSVGNFEIPEFKNAGSDEISVLASSFNRMRRSLEKAMKMIDES